MESIHGVDVSWLHNTNSRGMCGPFVCPVLYSGLVGGGFEGGEFEDSGLESRLGEMQLKALRRLQLMLGPLSYDLE